ncbi:hypothetical protein CCR75_006890 [Bremia lactucae]|uniref:Guanine nucleotide-binding protein subunit beta-like protein n=1 Tax=Bremia lactucae TaxID=4779 RepID=A0A976FFT7_BRELC|nr:hypothetical protein CCR75_006890 [Bremia lactucae]
MLFHEERAVAWDPFAMESHTVDVMMAASLSLKGTLNYERFGQKLGVERNVLKLIGKSDSDAGCLRFLTRDNDLTLEYRRRAVEIWDLAVGKLKIRVEAHEAGVRDLQIFESRLVAASNDRVIKVWDTAFCGSLQGVQELGGHGDPVHCVSLGGPAGPTVCTGAADGLVRVWDFRYVGSWDGSVHV